MALRTAVNRLTLSSCCSASVHRGSHLLLRDAGQVGQREPVLLTQELAEVAHLDARLHRHLTRNSSS